MTYQQTTAPTYLPLTLASVKVQLKLRADDTSEDDLLTQIIKAATDEIQIANRCQLMPAVHSVYLDVWPETTVLYLKTANPVQEVTSITYYDAAGDLQTLSSSTYHSDCASSPARIYLESKPSLRIAGLNNVIVTIKTGYSLSSQSESAQRAAIPASLVQAVMLRVATLYERREDAQLDPSKIRASQLMAAPHQNSYY